MNTQEWETLSADNAPRLDKSAAKNDQAKKDAIKPPKEAKAPKEKSSAASAASQQKKVAELHKMEMEARAREDEVEKAEMKGYLFSKWDKYKRRFPEYAPAGA